jgi:hypothetical protein
MGALKGRRLWGVLVMAVATIATGCATRLEPSVKHVGHQGPRHRLDLLTNPNLSRCDDYNTLFEHLSPSARDSIDPNGDQILRVAIDRHRNDEKRLYVELEDDQGRIIDHVDQALGEHMDCKRTLSLAARFASEMIAHAEPRVVASKPRANSLPAASNDEKKADNQRTRRSARHHEDVAENKVDGNALYQDEPIRKKQRNDEPSKDWTDVPQKQWLEREQRPAERRDNNYAAPQNEVFRPLPSSESCPRDQDKPSAPTISNQGSPITVTVINGNEEDEKKDEKSPPDPMIGPNMLIGGGVLRGSLDQWNIAARVGAGYLSESGKFEFDADLTGAGGKSAGADTAKADARTAFALNLGLCGRSSPLGFCLLFSGLGDINFGSGLDAKWNAAWGFGGGIRSWLQAPLADTWGLRINLEVVVPIKMQDKFDSDARIWDPLVPTSALTLTLVHAFKQANPDKDDKGKGGKQTK